jgi:voltage-gated sodium channel
MRPLPGRTPSRLAPPEQDAHLGVDMSTPFELCRRIAAHPRFQQGVLGLILLNAVVMGLETWAGLAARWGQSFGSIHSVVQALFVAELLIRVLAHGRRPQQFFGNGWNVFDFGVVALSLLPAAGPMANVARLARVLRVGRLISGVPELRLIIETMLRSIPSMAHIVLLVGILIYIYGVVGHQMFSGVDPEHWGNLGRAARTLFIVITLEGWVELLAASSRATPWALLYYVSFVVIAVFVVVNLFIAVVLNNLEKVRSEMAEAEAGASDTVRELQRLHARLDALHAALNGAGVTTAPPVAVSKLGERDDGHLPQSDRSG